MSFEITNALAIFQRLIKFCICELHMTWCIIHLEAIIVFSQTLEEHLIRHKTVFD